jgi:hypothetical protein
MVGRVSTNGLRRVDTRKMVPTATRATVGRKIATSWLVEKFGPIPETAEQPGGGGRHLIFNYGGGAVPKTLAPGIDLKGHGGYIFLAPSRHASGRRYDWDGIDGKNALLKPADAPAWLLAYIQSTKTQGRSIGAVSKLLPEVIPDGKKHDTIVSLAGSVKQRGLPKQGAFTACRALQFESPVSDDDIWERVKAYISSILANSRSASILKNGRSRNRSKANFRACKLFPKTFSRSRSVPWWRTWRSACKSHWITQR